MTADEARAHLVDELADAGDLADGWADAFMHVPRHAFLPPVIWQVDPAAGGRLVPVDRDTDPDRWWAAAYANLSVNTQVDDGHPADDGTGWEVTSSSSAPAVVAQMLGNLDVQPGMRVLEIGTGTGWNAALLAHRVGPEAVVSVEFDPVLAERARANLDAAGCAKVTVHTGDGLLGASDDGPFDRVIATVGVAAVPVAWVEQTRPGGRIVAPLTNSYRPPGVAVLAVNYGGAAVGRLAGDADFMGTRQARLARPPSVGDGPAEAESETLLHPFSWAGDRSAAVAIGLRLRPGLHRKWDGRTGTEWIYAPADGSWASVELSENPPYRVEQAGPRRCFDEVEAAYWWWHDEIGAAPVTKWLIRVSAAGQTIELG